MKNVKFILTLVLLYFHGATLFSQINIPQNKNIDSVSTIKVNGLKRTKLITIYRELNYEEGRKLFVSDSLINRWELRLSSLNLFTDVNVFKISDTLHINVTEEFYYWLNPVGGFADRNFHNWLLNPKISRLYFGGDFLFYNLFGLNHTCTMTLVGGFNQQIGLGYEWPNSKFGKGWLGKVKFLYSRNHEIWLKTENNQVVFYQIEPDYAQQITSISAKFSKKLNYENSIEIGESVDFYRVDPSVYFLNNDYLLGGNELTINALNFGYVYDSRNQRHYPTEGSEFKICFDLQHLISKDRSLNTINSIGVKLRKFIPLNQYVSFGMSIASQYRIGKLNYLMSRQLGYGGEYVRGYEQYVLDGAGFAVAKVSLRAKLFDQKIKVRSFSKVANYENAPLAVWFTVFSDNGKVISPNINHSFLGNFLQYEYLKSLGFGIDILAYYDLLTRFDVTRNHFGNWIFNLSFKHAI